MLPSPDLHLLGLARAPSDPAEPHRRELLRLRREAARRRRAALLARLRALVRRGAAPGHPPSPTAPALALRLAAGAPRAAAGTRPATPRAA